MNSSSQNSEQKTCSNKHCPQNNFIEGKLGVNQLCPVCLDRYKKDFFCVYCHQVYFEFTDDGKNWIQCDECQGWVHEQCADVFVSRNNPGGAHVNFKCIKCKKLQNKETGILPRRGVTRAIPKNQKKNQSATFFNIGFQWALKQEQIAEDMKKIQQYLR